MSNSSEVRFDVPQGSILGPLLFILVINDLESNIIDSSMIMFADDTSFFKVSTLIIKI